MLTRYITIISLLTVSTIAQAMPPIRFIQSEVAKVRTLLKTPVVDGTPEKEKIDDELRTILNPVMNFDRLSENALRSHWATLTDIQRKDFISLFRALVFHSYIQKIRSADEAYTIDYEAQQSKGPKAASVTAVAKTKTTEIELVFHILEESKGRWSVEDIVIDEVSLVENYREQFDKIIKKSGFEELLNKMSTKLTKLGGKVPPLNSLTNKEAKK